MKLNLKRIALVIAAILAGTVSAVAIQAPASAAAGDCGINRFCIWTGPNYTGARYDYTASAFINQCIYIGGGKDNTTNSLVINASGYVQLYSNNCSSQVITTVTSSQYKHTCGEFSFWAQAVSTCGTPTGSYMYHGG